MPRPGHDIITIGASAGGLEAVCGFLGQLPADLPASLFVVIHITSHYPSQLASILERAGNLPAVEAQDGIAFQKGRIYVARPDHHMLLEPERIRVVHGPKENRNRPAIDPLFRSAAWALGPRVTAVVLSGTLDDGAAGLWAVKSTGGTTIVQDPSEALFSGMPTSALLYSRVDHCLPLREIAPLLVRLAHEPANGQAVKPETLGEEMAMSEDPNQRMERLDPIGDLSAFTCPSCGGALWEIENGGVLRYRCHTGHAYNGESLVADQGDRAEAAVYTALRALKEQAEILKRVGGQLTGRATAAPARYADRVKELEEAAEVLKNLLQSGRV